MFCFGKKAKYHHKVKTTHLVERQREGHHRRHRHHRHNSYSNGRYYDESRSYLPRGIGLGRHREDYPEVQQVRICNYREGDQYIPQQRMDRLDRYEIEEYDDIEPPAREIVRYSPEEENERNDDEPTKEFDIPRWHVDDNFFSAGFSVNTTRSQTQHQVSKPNLQPKTIQPSIFPTSTLSSSLSTSTINEEPRYWKLAATLLGPPTLFLPLPSNTSTLTTLSTTKSSFSNPATSTSTATSPFLPSPLPPHTCTQTLHCTACSMTSDAIRLELASRLHSIPTISPGYGEVAFFRLGSDEGAVHSEPVCDVDRVFVNVVPGMEGDMRALMARWGMREWPRAWCLGVPVRWDG